MGLKSKIRQYLSDKLGVTENKRLIQGLSSYVTLLGKDGMEMPYAIQKSLEDSFRSNHGIDRFNTCIHRNDVMLYNHIIHYQGDTDKAVQSYFEVGALAARKVKALVPHEVGEILDFGSGYGRMSRFLPHYFPQSNISVSEVKEVAMHFQKEQLGFTTYPHTESADSLELPQQELIIAISVFTHLPESACKDWINKLSDALQANGKLVFTFNGIENCPFPNDGQFHYEQQSEDSSHSGIPDKLDDVAQYGSTYFSDERLKSLVNTKGVTMEVVKSFLGTHHAMVLSKI